MMNLKTGADIAVYLRNVAKAISEISTEKGITVDFHINTDGYIDARFGDYEYVETPDWDGRYYFRPLCRIEEWKRVEPCEIP